MSNMEQRLGPGMLYEGPSLEPGIVRTYPDGLMWLIKPDGTRCLIPCAGGGGGGAPVDAEYVVMALNGTLTNERVLAVGDALSLTDGGAGGNAELDVLVDGITIQVNGGNQLEVISAGPTGPAGGVLDGFYPNPGLAASVAGDGLSELLNVLNVNVGDALAITADIIDVQVDGTTIQVNGSNQLEVVGGSAAPVNAQYVTMALDATLTNERVLTAGDGLDLTDGGAGGNALLDVLVDGLSIGLNGSNELEVIGGALTNAVIKNPLTSIRNTITGTGNVINLPLVGEAAQTADLFTVAINGSIPFYRLFANETVGVGAGTFNPATYEGFNSLYVFSRNSLVAGGGPAIMPGAGVVSIPFRIDTQVQPTANTSTIQNFHTKVVYDGLFTTSALSATYTEMSFRGMKASASGNQVLAAAQGQSILADQRTGSTGDIRFLQGMFIDVRGRGAGSIEGVRGIENNITLSTGNPPVSFDLMGLNNIIAVGAAGGTIPQVSGVEQRITGTGRAVTLMSGFRIVTFGGTGVVEARAVDIPNVSASATTAYSIYSAGGQSLLQSGLATVVPLTLRGFTAQSGDLQRWQSSVPTTLLAVQADGDLAWNANEFTLGRTAANVLTLTGADLAVGSNLLFDSDGFINGAEIATPATPAANNGRLYFRDSGGGVTQLIALWPSGNTTVVAEDF